MAVGKGDGGQMATMHSETEGAAGYGETAQSTSPGAGGGRG